MYAQPAAHPQAFTGRILEEFRLSFAGDLWYTGINHKNMEETPMKTSLLSVTFRKKTVEEIVDLAARGGVDAIEWD